MDFNTRIPGAHLRGPLTRPDHRADLLHTGADVRSPKHRAKHLLAKEKGDWSLLVKSDPLLVTGQVMGEYQDKDP